MNYSGVSAMAEIADAFENFCQAARRAGIEKVDDWRIQPGSRANGISWEVNAVINEHGAQTNLFRWDSALPRKYVAELLWDLARAFDMVTDQKEAAQKNMHLQQRQPSSTLIVSPTGPVYFLGPSRFAAAWEALPEGTTVATLSIMSDYGNWQRMAAGRFENLRDAVRAARGKVESNTKFRLTVPGYKPSRRA